MTDYYLEDRTRLGGQPKRVIGEYVESQGILVPRRFMTLKEARESGLLIIARSEHTQDYDGLSGLLRSPVLQGEDFGNVGSEEELKTKVLAEPECGTSMHRQMCNFTKYDEDRFKAETSFSFWEMLGGFNRTVVADTAIPDRHHVMTYLSSEGKWFFNYAIVENSSVAQEFIKPLTPELKEGLPALIEFYEKVRHLGRFDRQHCPIMEIQTVGDKNYFLQYLRTRDSQPATFRLERELKDGEIEAPFVRGATPSTGADYKVTVYYANQDSWGFELQGEDGSWDNHFNHVFSELQVRNRKIQMTSTRGDVWWELMKYVVHHLQKSKLFKPEVSVIANMEDFFVNGEDTSKIYQSTKNGQNYSMMLNVVSDGKRCLMRRLK
ncbi:hypothetical protein HYW76_02445 [Candidatus Pacearchaeota archaeon]|nr:hypothetical protein [Candidatus Pacearchaeota archaeon]